MRNLDKVFHNKDEIEAHKKVIREAQRIPGATVINNATVIRRLPNGITTVESLSSFLDRFPGRI